MTAALTRWVTFAAIALLTGAVVFFWWVIPRARRGAAWTETANDQAILGAARIGALGALVLILAGFVRLWLQVADLRDPGVPWQEPAALLLQSTIWGKGWILQMVAALTALVALPLAWRTRGAWFVAALGALGSCIAPALSGHAVGSPMYTTQAVVADSLHVLASGAWLGTLAVVVTAGFPAAQLPSGDDAARELALVRAFSPLALASAAMIVMSGVFASWLHLDQLSSLWLTPYGRVLLGKIALVAVVLGAGAFNWKRQTPRMHAAEGVAAMRRSARRELALGALVFLLTAVLVATPLPGE